MIERTKNWLMKRRDGKGGFERNSLALDCFGGAPESTTNAYIVWALSCSGEKHIEKELDHLLNLRSSLPLRLLISDVSSVTRKKMDTSLAWLPVLCTFTAKRVKQKNWQKDW